MRGILRAPPEIAAADSMVGAIPTELDAEAGAPSDSGYGDGHGDDREI